MDIFLRGGNIPAEKFDFSTKIIVPCAILLIGDLCEAERKMTIMAEYNPRSLRAEEFINHEEILATLQYA